MSVIQPEGDPSSAGGPLVLLADDEPHITLVVSRKLRSAGLDVVTAEDGEEALDLALERPPTLVITDLQMPYMTGIDLARALKSEASTSEIPVIMLTARGYVLNPAQLASTNIRFVMSKPFSAREILEKVFELLPDAPGGLRKTA
ncbi:MAG: response regulator [Phycisphaerales bacterium]